MKLICFTYAGGNASFYNQLKKELLPDIEIIALEYSGHGERHKSPFYSDFSELTNDMMTQLENIIDENAPYAIMGYSMGSIAAVEVLQRIIKKGMALPQHIFLAAHEPHTKSELEGYKNEEMDEAIKERTIRFGAVPEKLISNKSFWRMYLPIYRADYAIIGKYSFEKLSFNVDIPATVFYSEKDTPFDSMRKWDKYFNRIEFIEYTGNHFFINEHLTEMTSEIKRKLV